MNDINRKLLTLLLEKTNKKLLQWTRGSSVNEYKTELNSATLSISCIYDTYGYESYTVCMYNGTGGAIILANEDENTSTDYSLVCNLYNAAKDSCTKESETVESLIKELSNLTQED